MIGAVLPLAKSSLGGVSRETVSALAFAASRVAPARPARMRCFMLRLLLVWFRLRSVVELQAHVRDATRELLLRAELERARELERAANEADRRPALVGGQVDVQGARREIVGGSVGALGELDGHLREHEEPRIGLLLRDHEAAHEHA